MQLKLKRPGKHSQDGGRGPRTFFSRQMLLSPGTPRRTISVEDIQTGSFYEINHARLSPYKYPEQLKSIRVVMVTDKNEDSISLRYPSLYSIRKHMKISQGSVEEKMHPALDEKYVMCSEVAREVLSRRISPREFADKSHSWSFWVANGCRSSSSTPPATSSPGAIPIRTTTIVSKKGYCWSELKCSGMVGWGKKRRVRFLSRHIDQDSSYNLNLLSLTARVNDGDDLHQEQEDVEMLAEPQKKEQRPRVRMPRIKLDEGLKEEEEEEEGNDDKDDDDEVEEKEEDHRSMTEGPPARTRSRTLKRKCFSSNNTVTTTSRALTIRRGRSDSTKMQIIPYNQRKKRKVAKNIDRWSAERYKMAEENMLKILKENVAVYGNPILRPALRAEARKLIGDTGLLDHLLKHMAGKIAPGGKERFRRRHNADGAMEYWLESAELDKLREKAGVADPYWTPPPGWKLGDSPSQDPVCAREIKFIKDEILQLKSEMQELQCKNREGGLGRDNTNYTSTSFNLNLKTADLLLLPLQEMYVDLMKKKAQAEEQLQEISHSLAGMQLIREDMERLVSLLGEPKRAGLEGSGTALSGITEERRDGGGGLEKKKKKPQAADDDDDDNKRNVSVSLAKTTAATTVGAEEKAARIERLKSGFRICKPQGNFLWPNSNITSQQLPSSSSPRGAAGGDVEEELLTPPSVTSSSSSSLSQSHYHHQPPRLPEIVMTKLPPTSPPPDVKKPMAEKQQMVQLALADQEKNVASSKINLNELPPSNIIIGPSSITYRRRMSNTPAVVVLPAAPTPIPIPIPIPASHHPKTQPQVQQQQQVKEAAQTQREKEDISKNKQQQQEEVKAPSSSSSPSSSPWLALATPSPPDL